MKLEANIPSGPAREEVGQAPLRDEARQPGQQAQVHGHRGRLRPGRRGRRRLAGRARLQRQVLLLPGLAPPGALDRRAGRHQRRQELPERRRQRLPAVLRHRQGRRLPRPRGQRLPARPGLGRTSSTSAWRRACPFAREYGGLLDNRSFGGAQVSRTFYARGQTGQQLLLGAYQALERQIGLGTVEMYSRHEMLELVVVDGRARGIVVRDMVTGEIETHLADAVVPGHRRLRQRLLPLDQRQGLQRHRHLARVQEGRRLRQPLLHADPPDLHPGHRRLPVEADADERVAAQRRPHLGARRPRATSARRARSPRPSATTTSSACTRASATSRRATSPRAPPSRSATRAAASARRASASTSTSRTPSSGSARTRSRRSTATSSRCTSASPTRTRTRCRCGSTPPRHYTMGGLWVDYNLMSTIPGLFVLGEANFSDHGANRLGASRADAGPRRRLLRHPLHDRQLPRPREVREGRPPTTPRSRRPRRPSPQRTKRLLAVQGQAHRDVLPPGARQAHVGPLRHGPRQEGPRARAREDPRPARGVLEERARSRARARSSTSRSRTPAASPTSSSSAS